MSAPAVKPALPAPSGAQAPRVGSGAPNTTPSNTSPGSATGAPKLSPSSVNVSPVKPSMPTNANHAMSAAVPLSLVQEHKAQGNALPQPSVGIQRTPEKPKDLVAPTMTPSLGQKPTSNGVEGSPGKVPLPSVQLPPAVTENKKAEDALSTTALLNHSTDGTSPASAAGPVSAPASTIASNANVQSTVPTVQTAFSVSSNVNPSNASHTPASGAQQSPAKAEPLATPAVSAATAPPAPALPVAAPKNNTVTNNSSSSNNIPATKSEVVASSGGATTTSADPAPVESKPTASANATAEDPTPSPVAPVSGPGPRMSPAPEALAKPAPPAPPEVTKTRIEISKPEFKVATPPRVSKRKREAKPVVETKAASIDTNDDRKSKRVRTRTQPYQSPLPELTYIAKIKNLMKSADDKLIVFYKNEFLAVRNAEGSFYVCQAMQNIYKSSTRIRIRWLSQDKKDNKETNVYIPDFYDVTEFDCILTNLELKKLDKNKYQLPQEERERTQSILKRALDVEKGVAEKPPITEEHPDGLDLSLYRDEAQLKKKRSAPKASKKAKKAAGKLSKEAKDEDDAEGSEESQEEAVTGDSEEDGGGSEEKKKAVNKPHKSKASKKEKPAKASSSATVAKEKTSKVTREKDGGSPKKERTSERGREREATKRRAEAPVAVSASTTKNTTSAKPPPEKKMKVATVSTPKPVRKADKPEPAATSADTSIPTRATKSRSAKTAAALAPPPSNKTSPVTRTKERERRAVTTSSRKKPGKKA